MKKWMKIRAVTVMLLAVVMGIPQNLVFAETPQEPRLESEVQYDTEKKKAEIKLTPEVDSSRYTVKEVMDPHGESMDLSNLNYEVIANGEYIFTLRYTEKQEAEDREPADIGQKEETIQEIEEKVVIKDIVSEKAPKAPAATSTTGTESIQISIDGYDPAKGDIWSANVNKMKSITVTADFGDTISENKTLEVYLPRGLVWNSIPVVEGKYDTKIVSQDRLEKIDKDPLYSAIVYTDLSGSAKKEDFSQEYSGSLIYTFTPGTEKITLKFNASVDTRLIYSADLTLSEKLTAKLGKGVQSDLRSEEIGIRVGGSYGNISDTLTSSQSISYSQKIMASTDENTYYNETNHVNASGALQIKATFVLHYPKEMQYESIVGQGSKPTYIDSIDTSTPGVAKVTFKIYQTNEPIGVRFSIPKGAKGIYTVTEKDYAEFEYFDGTKQTVSVSSGAENYSFEVIEGSSVQETMHITGVNNDKYVDNTVEDAFSYGPIFIIDNSSNIGYVKNQTVEFDIEPNWQVTRVHLPFDGTITDNTITNLQYRTNKNNNWQDSVLIERDLKNVNGQTYVIGKELRKDLLKLEKDEYITGVKYITGSFSKDYRTVDAQNGAAITTYGKLKSDASVANVVLSFYEEADRLNTLVSKTGTVQVAQENFLYGYRTAEFRDDAGTVIRNLTAGSTVKLDINAQPHYYHGDKKVQSMKDIIFYLREEDGFYFQFDSLEIKDQDGKILTNDQYSIIERKSFVDGKTIYEIRTKNTFWAGHYGENDQIKNPHLYIDVSIDPKMESKTFNFARLANYTGAYVEKVGGGTQDIYDMNGNGSTSDFLLISDSTVQINKNENVLVETYLSLAGQGNQKPYVEGDRNTLSYFTPGTRADYLVNILNNTDGDATAFDAYVPIPKKGQNFGTAFQKEDFKWDMKLGSEIVLSAEDQRYFDIYYATDADAANYQDISLYSKTPPADISKVNMVLIKAKAPIPARQNSSIRVSLVIDETLDSAKDSIGTHNIYNPVYSVSSNTFVGILNATKVGAELVIAEISGTMFRDQDGDGKYTIGKDVPVSAHTVQLYKHNDKTNLYEPVLDDKGNPMTTVTDMNGKYQFDYHQNLGYETYAVSFGKLKDKEKYTIYSSTDAADHSNVINKSNFPNSGDDYEGWIIGIDATKPQSTRLNAGVVSYDADALAISDVEKEYTVKERQQITIEPTITPGIFDGIKDPDKGYQWELVNASDNQYVNLINPKEKNLKISGKLTTGVNKVQVKLTIVDIYGNERTAETEIVVQTNEAPVITVPKVIEKNVGDLWDARDPNIVSGLTIRDDHDTVTVDDITITGEVPVGGKFLWLLSTKDTDRLTDAGTYQITYSYTDLDGNTATEYLLLKVHGLPYLKNDQGMELDKDTMPAKYVRIGASIDPFENIHAYYQKASDRVGGIPVETEIVPGDSTTGSITMLGTWDKENNPVSGGIIEAGKYHSSYKMATLSNGTIEVSRTVYARGKIKAGAQAIAIKDDGTTYTSLKDFLKVYGDKIKLQGSVEATDANGNVTEVNLTDFTLQEHEDISNISFDRTDKSHPMSITIHVLVHDREDANYEPASLVIPLVITVQDTTGLPPVIAFKDKRAPTERKTTDKVLLEPEKVTIKEQYDNAIDLLENGNHSDPLTFYHKLMSDADIQDQADPTGIDSVGIQETGIAAIKKINSDLTETVLIHNDQEARDNQDTLIKLYSEIGHYEVSYYAIDNDGNRIESARHIHTAGETQFVKNMTDKPAADEKVTLRTDEVNPYQPSGVLAYHIDYDGEKVDETTVYDPSGIDIKTAGRYTAAFTTAHHYPNYEETGVARGADTFTQTIEVYGPITFENMAVDSENFFTDETVDLKKAAAYIMGPTKDSDTQQKITVNVQNSLHKDALQKDDAGTETVIYTADDGLGLSDSFKTLTKTYRFYGLPELMLTKDEIEIGEMSTKDEVSKRIGARATVELPEGGTANAAIMNSFMNYNSTGNTITVTASFTTPDGKTRTDSKEVKVVKVAGAKLEAHDFTLNVGDEISDDIIKNLSGLEIEHDSLSRENVTVTQSIPQAEGKVTTAGSYEVMLTADDGLNVTEFKITVYVNSQPSIQGLDTIETREGMAIDIVHGVKASYDKAGTEVEFDFSSTGKDSLIIAGYEAIGEDGTRQSVNAITNPGVYVIHYRAMTESKGQVTAERTVIVHGIPVIQSNASIAIRKGESADDFLNRFKQELNIKATVIQTELKDGKAVLKLMDLVQMGNITIDLSRVKFDTNGSYDAIIKATANQSGIPEYMTERKITVNVGDYQGAIPEITTSIKERQSDDPIQNETKIIDYLLSEQVIQVTETDYDIQNIELKSIIKQTTAKSEISIDITKNEELKNMMRTIGIYTLTYEITDAANNRVEAKAEFRVHGPVKFGIQHEDGSITELDSVIETRQSDGNYTGNGLVTYQMKADGKTVSTPIQLSEAPSLDKVAMHELELKGSSVSDTYEDGQKRPIPAMKIKLLVQGNIVFHTADTIETYQGSQLKGDYKAMIQTVDENGKITDTKLPVTIRESVKTDTIHNGTIILEARDTVSQAPNDIQTYNIHVKVHGLPVIEVADHIEVKKGSTVSEISELLKATGWYMNSDGQRVDLTLQLNYGEINEHNELIISVGYEDQGEMKVIEKKVGVSFTEPEKETDKDKNSSDKKEMGQQVATGDPTMKTLFDLLAIISGALIFLIMKKKRFVKSASKK